jgi:hypothetical protein
MLLGGKMSMALPKASTSVTMMVLLPSKVKFPGEELSAQLGQHWLQRHPQLKSLPLKRNLLMRAWRMASTIQKKIGQTHRPVGVDGHWSCESERVRVKQQLRRLCRWL